MWYELYFFAGGVATATFLILAYAQWRPETEWEKIKKGVWCREKWSK